MAIQLDFIKQEDNFTGQLVATNAYWKVDKIKGNKDKCIFTVGVFTEQDKSFVGSINYEFTPNMDGDNFIKQAYQHLKTLPEFADATDV
jgi:hypothetical protein